MKKSVRILLVMVGLLLLLWSGGVLWFQWRYPPEKWDWSKIDTDDLAFPSAFLWGTATSAYQVEGGNTNSQWYMWEHERDEKGDPRILNGDTCGMACDSWHLYPLDIRLMKHLGLNAYRFSVEWSKIEPREGVFDEEVIRHYQKMCDSLLAAGIEPVVTLHHVTNPLWFERKGAWEKEENISDFLVFVEKIVRALGNRVRFYCTINEPAVYAMESYFSGAFPPGKKDPVLTALVLRNLLMAHVRTYRLIKSLPGGREKMVGIVKNITPVDPASRWSLADWLFSRLSDRAFNGVTLDFLRTGHYRFYMPGMASLRYDDPDAPGSLDFFGLNYYSHYVYRFSLDLEKAFEPVIPEGEVMTDMEYTIYPEGFYRALWQASTLGVPVIVTENGIADARDDRRDMFIRRHLYALSRAMKEGCDVCGYFYWSLMDNFEWAEGYSKKFGLYAMDPATRVRTLRPGARVYGEIVKRFSSASPTKGEKGKHVVINCD